MIMEISGMDCGRTGEERRMSLANCLSCVHQNEFNSISIPGNDVKTSIRSEAQKGHYLYLKLKNGANNYFATEEGRKQGVS